jgi:hypothetical protein
MGQQFMSRDYRVRYQNSRPQTTTPTAQNGYNSNPVFVNNSNGAPVPSQQSHMTPNGTTYYNLNAPSFAPPAQPQNAYHPNQHSVIVGPPAGGHMPYYNHHMAAPSNSQQQHHHYQPPQMQQHVSQQMHANGPHHMNQFNKNSVDQQDSWSTNANGGVAINQNNRANLDWFDQD